MVLLHKINLSNYLNCLLGFYLWTSAHGFHHLSLSNRKGWKCLWAFILLIVVVALVACIIYYFYYVFTNAVYSLVTVESPGSWEWPTTVVCDKKVFRLEKITQIPSFNTLHASLLTWSLAPVYSNPELIETNGAFPVVSGQLDQVLKRGEFNQSIEALMASLAPSCDQLVLECLLGSEVLDGKKCCLEFFNPQPAFTQHGACFTTRGATRKHRVSVAGEAGAVTLTLMLGRLANPFSLDYTNKEFNSVGRGINFAVIDESIGIDAALKTQGQSVQPGKQC